MELDAPAYELRGPLALSRATLDRAGDMRTDDAALAEAWADPRTAVLVVADGKVPEYGGRLVLVSTDRAPAGDRFLLGVDGDGVAYFAVHVPGPHPGERAVGVRAAALRLDDRDAGLMVHAVALANWHSTHGHCSRCGTPTVIKQAGHVRRCPADGSEHYPRTDPVVIVLVVDENDRALLGRSPEWPEGRFSTLAGFVEPGETPEQAVVREVREETRVDVTACRYVGSQPWPFPASLMLGYYARARGIEPKPDGGEISEARWYTREDVGSAIRSGELVLPPSAAISRRLIEGWYGREL